MPNRSHGLVSVALVAAAIAVFAFSAAAQNVPPQLQPPANEQLLLRVHAKGDQVYTCKTDAATPENADKLKLDALINSKVPLPAPVPPAAFPTPAKP